MISRAASKLVTLFFLLCKQIQALERWDPLQLFLKSVLQKRWPVISQVTK